MTTDTDGATLMHVWGASGPPRHPDGSLVVTPRLFERLTPLERALYSGDDLRVHLARRVLWLTEGESVDGWDSDDLIAFGLERAAKLGWYTRAAVSTWIQRKVSTLRKRESLVRFEEIDPDDGPGLDPEAEPATPVYLPVEVVDWLRLFLPETSVTALVLYSEQGLTPAEAARTVNISRKTFYQALNTLKGRME